MVFEDGLLTFSQNDPMPDPQIPFRTEKLSSEEIRSLRWRMILVWLIAALMISLISYFASIMSLGTWGMRIPLILFAVFFFGILIFIIAVHTVNAFRTEKRVYSGRITDKKTEASRMRNSHLSESYYVSLDGHWFRVELNTFSHAHVGDEVEISTFGKGQVLSIERKSGQPIVSENSQQLPKQTNIYGSFPDYSEKLSESEAAILKKALLRAIFLRVFAGFVGAYISYFILSIVVVFTFIAAGTDALIYIFYAVWLLVIGGFLWLNLKTIRLVRDILGGEKQIVSEPIIDLVHSTHRKPGPNSIVTTTYYSAEQFYYIQTDRSWLRTDEETFQKVVVGKSLKLHRGPKSRVILRIEP